MADSSPPMVMRSVYLPSEMDSTLRALAFQLRVSKAELIRSFVASGLNDVVRRLGPRPDEKAIAKVARTLGGRLSDAEQQRSEVAMARFREAVAESTRGYERT